MSGMQVDQVNDLTQFLPFSNSNTRTLSSSRIKDAIKKMKANLRSLCSKFDQKLATAGRHRDFFFNFILFKI